MKRVCILLFLCLSVFLSSVANAGLLDGIGAIGDSLTDEYQFADGGNHSAGRNWLEQLATYRHLNFGSFSSSSRGEPRNAGYEYNWSRAGATSSNMIDQNQHTGVANQVNSGNVTLVCLMVGNNDLAKEWGTVVTNYQNIYVGGPAVWQPVVDTLVNNVKTAVNTILAANPNVKMVIGTAPDVELTPVIRTLFTDPARRQYVSDAFAAYNQRIETEVHNIAPDRIAIADVYGVSLDVLAKLKAGQNYTVGGYTIDLNADGNDPNKIILGDHIHPGTIMQGLVANEFIKAMNELGANVSLFSENEILNHAGVAPEPGTMALLIVGGSAILRRRFRS